MPDHLTIEEASEKLRIPVATLRNWRTRGIGPAAFRMGRRVWYRSEDLQNWLDAQAGGAR